MHKDLVVGADSAQPSYGFVFFFRPKLNMKILNLIRHHLDKISNRLAGEFTTQSTNTYNGTRKEVIKPKYPEPVVIFFMQSEIAADGNAHTNFNVTLHRLGII